MTDTAINSMEKMISSCHNHPQNHTIFGSLQCIIMLRCETENEDIPSPNTSV